MPNILLLGAGFSANWGAPVSAGMFNALIADPEIRANESMRRLLWANRKNFELVLATLQENFRRDTNTNREPLLLMQRALTRIFGRMNEIFRRQDFDLTQERLVRDRNRTMVEFLAKFDAIYTLNQDLLLEIHYIDGGHNTLTNRRWGRGSCMPGMVPSGAAANGAAWSGRIWNPGGGVGIPNQSQPYYKLHGSSNWKDTGNNADMMIMGGGKPDAIRAIPILQQYQDALTEHCRQGRTRMTVIGYGFADEHINAVLKDAVHNHGLQMFVIDPRGAAIAYEARPVPPGAAGHGPVEFDEWYEKGLYSASTVPFRSLLIGESLERETLMDFLEGR